METQLAPNQMLMNSQVPTDSQVNNITKEVIESNHITCDPKNGSILQVPLGDLSRIAALKT